MKRLLSFLWPKSFFADFIEVERIERRRMNAILDNRALSIWPMYRSDNVLP